MNYCITEHTIILYQSFNYQVTRWRYLELSITHKLMWVVACSLWKDFKVISLRKVSWWGGEVV